MPAATIVNPGDSWHVVVVVPGNAIPYTRPAWIVERKGGMFGQLLWPIDGIARPDSLAAVAPAVLSVAIPEQLRRTSDVTAIVAIGGLTLGVDLGAPTFAYTDPSVGVQQRALRSAPPVTLSFDRSLEWVRANHPIDHRIQLSARSFSDSTQVFHFKLIAPHGVRVDSLPTSVTLAPHEQRGIFLHLGGMLDTGRYEFGVIGEFQKGGRFAEGMRTTHYTHVPPADIFYGSGLWLQGVNVDLPKELTVAYISGAGEEVGLPAALRQIGVSLLTLGVDEFPMLDLTRFTTVVVGPKAYDLHPELIAENGRLFDFVRKGGTLVVLGQETSIPQALPFPVRSAMPFPIELTYDTRVTPVEPRSRLLRAPNVIGGGDWAGWIQDRAQGVPLIADAKYSTVIETHDDGEAPNRNSILTAQLGKGTYIYTTLTFYRQVAGGVSGSLRLLVNLLGAGIK
jgi:hypothetical protein